MGDSKSNPAPRSTIVRRGGWSWRTRRPADRRRGGLELPEIPADDLKTAEWRVLGLVKELQLLIDRFLCRNPNDLPLMEQIVATLVQYGLESGARTILFEPGRTEMSVRLRQNEPLEGKVRIPQSLYSGLFQVLKEAAGLDPDERRRPQEGPLLATHGDRRLELRLVCLPGEGGEVAHLHLPGLLPRFDPIGLGKLGLFPDQMAAVDEILARESGLLLVAGMAGEARTRALYALLNRTAPPHGHALCIEDPVRFLVPGTTQLSIDPAGGLSYPELLRTCLREEPDALLLGDLPDPETVRLTLGAARSGRKVLAGFPSDRAAAVPAGLISMGVPAYQVASGLAGVLAQRRARRLCQQCKRPDPNTALYRDRLCSLYGIWDHFPQEESAMTAAGCRACRQQGHSGYVLLFECLPITPVVRSAIAQNAAPDELQALATREGRVALATDGYRRVKMGEISLEELLRVLQG